MKVFFIGIGLIGGSMALEIKHKNPQAVCYGISRQDETLDRALALGLIDHKAVWEDLPQADLVFLSIPVDASVNALPRILDLIPDQSLVVDAGSTKQALCTAVAQHPKRRNYLAAHPIAGTEFSGPEAAFLGLFDQKTMIVCEVEKTAFKLQEKAMSLFTSWGMRIRYMDAAAHDKHIAYVSHLSHISSFMLGKTVIEKEKNESDIFDMAGSGFESTVRLAKSSPAMWTPIFDQNKQHVVAALEEYIANLEEFKSLLEASDRDAMYQQMSDTNKIKEILNRIPLNK